MGSIKDELEKIENEEIEMGEEDRLQKIEESICWLHRRIRVIAEHIDDKEEEAGGTEEEEVWNSGYSEGYEDGVEIGMGVAKETREGDKTKEKEIIEALAWLEHMQWMLWSKAVADEVSADRRERWNKLRVPYNELSEADKDKDRDWARRALQTVREMDESYEEGGDIEQVRAKNTATIKRIQELLNRPATLENITSQTQSAGDKGTLDRTDEIKEKESTKNRVLGLGRTIGDV